MKKKFFAIALAAVCVTAGVAFGAGCSFIDGGSSGLIYNLSKDKTYYTVRGADAFTGKKVKIPAKHNKLPVKEIEKYAFENCQITSVTVPDSITLIDNGAFKGCESLTTVTIPDSVTQMGERVFYGCKKLSSLKMPANLEALGNNAFNGCTALTEVKVTGTYTEIGEKTFYGCSALKKVTLPEGLLTIGMDAFNGCYNLSEINIPDTLTKLDIRAFYGCNSIKSVYLPDGISILNISVFENCSALENLSIGKGVTIIEKYALINNHLEEITFRGTIAEWESVRINENNAFITVRCTNGNTTTFPEIGAE